MDIQIIPTVVPQSVDDIAALFHLYSGLADWIHIDISDGIFGNGMTWNNPEELANKKFGNFEVHLMVSDPEVEAERWSKVEPGRLIFHVESIEHPLTLVEVLKSKNIEPVAALNLDTPCEALEGLVPDVQSFQLMSISKIGKQGESFQSEVFKKISSCKELFPDGILSIDGGVNLSNAHDLVLCGASRLCVGSALANTKNPRETFESLKNSLTASV